MLHICPVSCVHYDASFSRLSFLAHLAFRPGELLSSLFVRRPSSVRQHFTF